MAHNLLIVNGSPNPDGNSALIEKKLIQRCVKTEFNLLTLDVNQYADLRFDGNSSMFRENKISNKNVEEIINLFLSADSIIIISPVYLHHIPAAFKNVLEYISSMAHCFALHHKFFSTIVHSNSNGELQTSAYIEKIFNYMGATFVERILFNDFSIHDELGEKISNLLRVHKNFLKYNRYDVSFAQEKEFSNLKSIVAVEKENGIVSAKQKGWEILSNYDSYYQFISDIRNKSVNTYF